MHNAPGVEPRQRHHLHAMLGGRAVHLLLYIYYLIQEYFYLLYRS
jgi:hypothetical protein